MLTKEELVAFLAALLTFSNSNRLSASMCALLFGVSHPTMARWLRMARQGPAENSTVCRYLVDPIITKLDKLNVLNSTRGTFTAIAEQKPRDKVELLRGALAGRIV